MTYSKAINQQENRTGSLFQKNFRRKPVCNDAYFTRLIYYIHNNPVNHGLTNNLADYEWSSYGRVLIEKPSKLPKTQIISWFGSKSEYIRFHSNNQDLSCIKDYMEE